MGILFGDGCPGCQLGGKPRCGPPPSIKRAETGTERLRSWEMLHAALRRPPAAPRLCSRARRFANRGAAFLRFERHGRLVSMIASGNGPERHGSAARPLHQGTRVRFDCRAFAAPVCEVTILRYMMSSDRIGGDLLLDPELQALFAKCQRMTLRAWRTAAEAWLIARALEKTRGDRTKAARVLGVGRRKLDKRIRLLSIHPLRDGARKSGSRLRIVARSPATEPFVRQGRHASRKSTARRTCSGARAPDGRSVQPKTGS